MERCLQLVIWVLLGEGITLHPSAGDMVLMRGLFRPPTVLTTGSLLQPYCRGMGLPLMGHRAPGMRSSRLFYTMS